MLKGIKWLAAGLCVVAIPSLHAQTKGIANDHLGFYVGGGVGPDTVDFTQRARIFIPSTPGHPEEADVINKVHLAGTGFFGSIFAGASTLYDQYFLALEANANFSTVALSSYNQEYVHANFSNTSIKIKNTWGVSLLPGYQFTPETLFYGRAGVSTNKIQQKTSDTSLFNFNSWRTGFRYGLGIKQAITERLALRIEYSRITYNGMISATLDPVSLTRKTTKITPNQQVVEFGVLVNL